MPRNNPQIKRLAEYIHVELINPFAKDRSCWKTETLWYKEYCYDRAVELLKKLENRDFTGPDLHKD